MYDIDGEYIDGGCGCELVILVFASCFCHFSYMELSASSLACFNRPFISFVAADHESQTPPLVKINDLRSEIQQPQRRQQLGKRGRDNSNLHLSSALPAALAAQTTTRTHNTHQRQEIYGYTLFLSFAVKRCTFDCLFSID